LQDIVIIQKNQKIGLNGKLFILSNSSFNEINIINQIKKLQIDPIFNPGHVGACLKA
jgi:hypothetical protein